MAFHEKNRRYVFDGENIKKVDREYEEKRNYFERLYDENGPVYDPQRPLENVKRQYENERIKQYMLRVLLVVLVFTLAAVIIFNIFFKVRNIHVQGSELYSEDEIVQACGLDGKSVLLADTDAVADKLRGEFPMLSDVDVSVRFPDTVVLTLHDAEPSYRIVYDDEIYILSSDLDVLKKDTDNTDGLSMIELQTAMPPVVGKRIVPEDKGSYKKICELLHTLKDHPICDKVTCVNVDDGEFTLEYEDRLTLMLGENDGLETKLTLAQAYAEALDESACGIIDAKSVEFGSYLPLDNGHDR